MTKKKDPKDCKPGGRPTKYKAEYVTEEHTQGFIDYCEKKKEVVTLCGYAVYLGVSEDVFPLWKDKYPEFIVTVAKIKQISKHQMLQGGLNKKLSSKIVKLGLSANHGMSETTRQEHAVDENTATLLGMIDGSNKGQLPDQKEIEEAEE